MRSAKGGGPYRLPIPLPATTLPPRPGPPHYAGGREREIGVGGAGHRWREGAGGALPSRPPPRPGWGTTLPDGTGQGVSLAAAAELFKSTANLDSSRKEYRGVLRSLCRHLEGGRLVWNCPYRFVAAKSVSPAERLGGWLAPG